MSQIPFWPDGALSDKWIDIMPITELKEDVTELSFTNLGAKKILIYGVARLNDAENSLTTGSKRVAVYVNDLYTYSALLGLYARKDNYFLFNILFDVENGLLTGHRYVSSGSRAISDSLYALNDINVVFMDAIEKIRLISTIDGQYYIKSGSTLGVKILR